MHDNDSHWPGPLLHRQADLAAQRPALETLGVAPARICIDHGLSGTSCARPEQALAAASAGNALVVPKLDRLARFGPDARAIAVGLVGASASPSAPASTTPAIPWSGRTRSLSSARCRARGIRARSSR
ncbi:recombinase family protein [Methylorubrum rhodesianum]|uniref:recombinase family protein n=1 Tax=Methylorubrum rhodesianum TaxID=29427 RepID=UPI00289FFB0D|nr:recombinase family protein [Methylorubrum rhodesianum]